MEHTALRWGFLFNPPLPLANRVNLGLYSAVSKIEEIERIIQQLPPEDFTRKLSRWLEQRLQRLAGSLSRKKQAKGWPSAIMLLLNGYSPEDEGIYDDAAGR